MGVFDQSARYAATADAAAVTRRVLRDSGLSLTFREWLDTRALPAPGGRDRTADLVAAMDDPAAPEAPWLLLLEFQSQPDEDKLDVTLEEVANLRGHLRHGDDRKAKYKVIAGLVHLTGKCPTGVIDMTTPAGKGTRHEALVWDVATDEAAPALERAASGELSWGMLFWVPLMAGGGDGTVINRWKEVVNSVASEQRNDLGSVALFFAELAGRFLAWDSGLEGWEMTESLALNKFLRQMEVRDAKAFLLRLVKRRLSDPVPPEVVQTINAQPSLPMLEQWFDEASTAATLDDFVAVLKR